MYLISSINSVINDNAYGIDTISQCTLACDMNACARIMQYLNTFLKLRPKTIKRNVRTEILIF